jgi:hypothetical protein
MLTVKDLFSKEELEKYQSTLYPFNLSILHSAIKAKLEEDPNYEVWVPLIYYKYAPLTKDPSMRVEVKPFRLYISNHGKVMSTRSGTPKILKLSPNTKGYKLISVPNSKTRILAHRAVGCSFIPLPEELILFHPSDLVVNHKTGRVGEDDMEDLEWTTSAGNTLHAYGMNLINQPTGINNSGTKPVKGVVVYGPYVGHEFVLHGTKAYKEHGFTQSNISACCNGRLKKHKGCSWSFATDEELKVLPEGLNKEILDSLNI